MTHRTTEEVLRDHLALAQRGDIDADIERNFSPSCVLLTSYGVFRGHEGVREAAALLDRQVGRTHLRAVTIFDGLVFTIGDGGAA